MTKTRESRFVYEAVLSKAQFESQQQQVDILNNGGGRTAADDACAGSSSAGTSADTRKNQWSTTLSMREPTCRELAAGHFSQFTMTHLKERYSDDYCPRTVRRNLAEIFYYYVRMFVQGLFVPAAVCCHDDFVVFTF